MAIEVSGGFLMDHQLHLYFTDQISSPWWTGPGIRRTGRPTDMQGRHTSERKIGRPGRGHPGWGRPSEAWIDHLR